MATGLGGGLSSRMVTLGGNAGGVSFGTLGEGAGQSVWSMSAGEGRGAFEKMRESVWMAAN